MTTIAYLIDISWKVALPLTAVFILIGIAARLYRRRLQRRPPRR